MLAPETVLSAQYRISYAVEERADAVVYRASDTSQGLRVLIAELPQPPEGALAELHQRAEQIRGLNVPELLALRSHFAEGVNYYLVADDPGGQELERLVRERGGPLPELEVLSYLERLLHALEQLHSQVPPLLLGELRSTDLWLSVDGGLLLAPFALLRPAGAEASPYRAPELHAGSAAPTPTSDLYALGAVGYHMLTGAAPPSAAQRQTGTPLSPPRGLNPQISALSEQLVLRALDLKAANRYQLAREMRSALGTVRLMAGRSLGALAPTDQPAPPPAPIGPTPVAAPLPTEPASTYGPPPPAPPPAPPANWGATPQPAAPTRQVATLSHGCLLSLVGGAIIGLLALCLLGAWGALRLISQFATVPYPDGPPPTVTAEPRPGGMSVPVAPTAAPRNPTVEAIIRSGALYTQTRQFQDQQVGPVVYSPDGTELAVALGEVIELRDSRTLERRQRLAGHSGQVEVLAYSPNGVTLASGAQQDHLIRLWKVKTGEALGSFDGHTGWLRSLAFSPDGTLLASGSSDKTIIIWEVATGRQLHTLTGHSAVVASLAFSPDGTNLASVAHDGSVRVWVIASGVQRDGFSYLAPDDPQTDAPFWLTAVSYSPDGSRLAVGSVSGNIVLIDAKTGKIELEIKGHTDWISPNGLSYSPDGNLLASASLDGTVRLWRPRTGVERGLIPLGVRLSGLSWHPDGSTLALSSGPLGSVETWDVRSRERIASVVLAQGAVTALAYASNGTVLATGGLNGTVNIEFMTEGSAISLPGGAATSQSLAFLSDNELVAVSDGGTVMVLTLKGSLREERRALQGLPGQARAVEVSRDGRLIAAGNELGDIAIWDARSFQLQRTVRGLGGPVYGLAFNRDGSELAAATNQPAERPKAMVWEVASGKARSAFSGHHGPLTAIAMPAGSDLVATASSDGSLKLWQAGTGEELRVSNAPPEQRWYSSLAFSPDGALMATGSLGGQVEFWNPVSGERLSGVDLHLAGAILALRFRPDGGQLAVATRDGGVVLLEAKG